MATTYTPIATTTLGSAQASITFSSIASTYTDLVLIVNGAASNANTFGVQVNLDTGTTYSTTGIIGDGSTASSNRQTNSTVGYVGALATNGVIIVNFQNYANTTTYKTWISRGSAASDSTQSRVSLWRNTNAISTIKLLEPSGATFSTGVTATLYGIKAA